MDNELYSSLSNVVLVNLYTVTKFSSRIELVNFKRKNKNHMYLLEMSKALITLFPNTKIFLNCSLIDYLILKLKKNPINRISTKNLSKYKINIDNFLNHVSSANNVSPYIWEMIYTNWWGK